MRDQVVGSVNQYRTASVLVADKSSLVVQDRNSSRVGFDKNGKFV